jgi:hypothetical protein
LKALEAKGLIESRYRRIVVPSLPRLERFAGG